MRQGLSLNLECTCSSILPSQLASGILSLQPECQQSCLVLYVFWRSDVCASSPLSLSHFYNAYNHSAARCTPHSPVLKTEYEKQGVWPAQRSRSRENSPVDSDHPQPGRPKLTHGQPAQMSDIPAQCLCSVLSGTSMHTVWQSHVHSVCPDYL